MLVYQRVIDVGIWVCLKMLCTPFFPMVLLIIIPMKNGCLFGNIPYFQTNPSGFLETNLGGMGDRVRRTMKIMRMMVMVVMMISNAFVMKITDPKHHSCFDTLATPRALVAPC